MVTLNGKPVGMSGTIILRGGEGATVQGVPQITFTELNGNNPKGVNINSLAGGAFTAVISNLVVGDEAVNFTGIGVGPTDYLFRSIVRRLPDLSGRSIYTIVYQISEE